MTSTLLKAALPAAIARDAAPADLERRYGAANYHPLAVTLQRGAGVWLFDSDGRRYLDMMSAYSAVSFGHSHPTLVRALVEQARAPGGDEPRLPQRPLRPVPARGLRSRPAWTKALPMNTGAEAVETAVKAARKWGYKVKGIAEGRAEIIVAHGQLRRPHDDDRRLLERGPVPRRLRPVRARLRQRALRRRGRARGGDQAEHRRVPGRADPGRGRDHRAARRLPGAGARDLHAGATSS